MAKRFPKFARLFGQRGGVGSSVLSQFKMPGGGTITPKPPMMGGA